jgi:hypothetical protein
LLKVASMKTSLAISTLVFLVGCGATPSATDTDNVNVLNDGEALTSNATYTFGTAVHSGSCMDIAAAGTADGTQVQEYACNGTGAQEFQPVALDSTYFKIVNVTSGKCIDIAANATANGTKVDLYTCNGTSAQAFKFAPSGSGYTIVGKQSGKCLDITSASATNGTKVDLYTCNGTNAQLWFANSATATPPSNPPPPPPPPASGTKFVVYIDDWTGSWSSWATKIDFTKMTHLNLAFFTATTSNNWVDSSGQSDAAVKALVDKAHASGVKVLASLGGGGGDSTVVNQYQNSANDDALVSNLDALLTRLNLDGADIDIEKESTAEVGSLYGTFVSKVEAKLHPEGKLVTAAVAQYLAPYMPNATLLSFDFVNIMTYSTNTGDYTNDLAFFAGKGLPKSKLTAGIISESDQHTSVATTKAITSIAKGYGGPMLWDLAEDSTGSASVYGAIQSSL